MSAEACFMDKDRNCGDDCKAFSADLPYKCMLLASVQDVLKRLCQVADSLTAYRHPDPPTIGRHR